MAASGTIAALMEGKIHKAYLSMATLSDNQTSSIRGFTSLSVSLGCMISCLHDGLLHAIENEEKLSLLPHLFRTLNGLIAATPYDRMPSDLRTRIARTLKKCWMLYHGQHDGDISRETACLIALRATSGAMPSDPKLQHFLGENFCYAGELTPLERTVEAFLPDNATEWSLMDALLSVAYSQRDVIRSEALATLTCLASNYSSLFYGFVISKNLISIVIPGKHDAIERLLDKNITQDDLEPSGGEEKAAQQAIRFLGALMSSTFIQEDQRFLQQAVEAVSTHMLPSIQHSAPILRSAALSEIGNVSKSLLSMLSSSIKEKLMRLALETAASDPIAAVKSSACRMIGDWVNYGFYVTDKVRYRQVFR